MREGKHRLVRVREAGQGERARLVLPEGGAVELSREKWLRLAEVVGRMFGTREAKPARPRPLNHGRRWTESLDAEFATRWREGEAVAALATRFGRSRHAVEQRLVALELIHPMTRRPLVGRSDGHADLLARPAGGTGGCGAEGAPAATL